MGEPHNVTCQNCQSNMSATTKIDRNMGLQVVGVLLFVVAVFLLFVIPVGTIIGIILMVVAARLGYRKMAVWLCPGCGYFFERDKSIKIGGTPSPTREPVVVGQSKRYRYIENGIIIALVVTAGGYSIYQYSDTFKAAPNKKSITKPLAISMCQTRARKMAENPSTVAFSSIFRPTYKADGDGRVTLTNTFTVMSSANTSAKFKITCIYQGDKMIESIVNET